MSKPLIYYVLQVLRFFVRGVWGWGGGVYKRGCHPKNWKNWKNIMNQ